MTAERLSAGIPTVLERLASVRSSGDQWIAACPSHDDDRPSLSISVGEDGRILLKCHAGCDVKDIVKSIDLGMKDLFRPENPRADRTAYEIRSVDGTLVARHVRLDGEDGQKRMYWERPNGAKGLGGLKVKALPLYGSQSISAAPGDQPAVIVEGEKAADALTDLGFLALGTVTGASSSPSVAPLQPLLDRSVVLWPDNDDPGRRHMDRIARTLNLAGHTDIRFLAWEDAPLKGDAADAVIRGLDHQDVQALIDRAQPWQRSATDETDTPPSGSRARNGKVSQATALLNLVKGMDIELFHSPDGDPFFTVPVNGHRETYPLNSHQSKSWASRSWFSMHDSVPQSQAMLDAFRVLEGEARFGGLVRDVNLRTASHQGEVFIDLADGSWRVIRVTADGWSIVNDPPVRFVRSTGMTSLPIPTRGGSLRQLRKFVNLPDDGDWALFQAFLISALVGQGPFPIATFQGEQGSAKSTTARVVRSLIDPNAAPVRAEPRDLRDLMIAAKNSWLITLDNVSLLPNWLSDGLCRLSTGGGYATKTLYADDSETIFSAQRPIVINGIDEFGTRSDFMDRALVLNFPPIPDTARRRESEIWQEFEAAKPALFGALLDAAVCGVRNQGEAVIPDLPRMADFAALAQAAEPKLDCEPGSILVAYRANRRGANTAVLESSPITSAILQLVERGDWTGTSTELLDALRRFVHPDAARSSAWPKAPNSLSGRLARLAPSLRAEGVEVTWNRSEARRMITVRRPER